MPLLGKSVDEQSVEGNSRFTVNTAVVLLLLLAAEGLTILSIRGLLTWHVAIGMLVTPPLALKIASTSWRFLRYYTGSTPYTQKGPPTLVLRVLGPVIVLLTVAVVASGILLVIGAPTSWRSHLFFLHKASFFLWFVVTAVHVLGHLVETARLAPADWFRGGRRAVRGAPLRLWVLAASLVVGLLLAAWVTPHVAHWTFYGDQ
jgi:hypothetical protein